MVTVLYGVFVGLNTNEPSLPPDLEGFDPNSLGMDIELGSPVSSEDLVNDPAVDREGFSDTGKTLDATAIAIPTSTNPAALDQVGMTKQPAEDPASASTSLLDLPQAATTVPTDKQVAGNTARSTGLETEVPFPGREKVQTVSASLNPPSSTNSLGANSLGSNSTSNSGKPLGSTSSMPNSLFPAPPELNNSNASASTNLATQNAPTAQTPTVQTPNAASSESLPTDNAAAIPAGDNGSVPATSLADLGSKKNATTPGTDTLPPATTNPSVSTTPSSSVTISEPTFELARQKAMEEIQKGKLKEALQQLSAWYNRPELTRDQEADLINILDALAAEVIYSKRHFLESPYKIGPKETLEQVAEIHGVTTDLLASINQIQRPYVLLPSTELKVLRGPFRADIDLTTSELTLYLENMYAGRFPIEVGSDPSAKEGTFTIAGKQMNRNFYGSSGGTVGGNEPSNPYGRHWIDLGQQMCIHGSPENPIPQLQGAGCISLSPRDAEDVYNILTVGSKINIHR
jgi:hypothetical protein